MTEKDNLEAERAAPELKPCPMCGGVAHLTNGYATEQVWAHGVFYRVFCGACQIRQLFHRTEAEAIAAWNRRAPAVGEDAANSLNSNGVDAQKCEDLENNVGKDGLPPLPTNVAHVTRRIHRCECDVPAQVVLEHFAMEYARDAVAADRQARPQQIADIILHLIGECTMDWKPSDDDEPFSSDDAERGYIVRLVNQALAMRAQQPASAAQGVKTWQERMPEHVKFIGSASSELPYMKAEIEDLRNFTASLQASLDAAVSLAGETIDARNAEIADLRAQLARKCQEDV